MQEGALLNPPQREDFENALNEIIANLKYKQSQPFLLPPHGEGWGGASNFFIWLLLLNSFPTSKTLPGYIKISVTQKVKNISSGWKSMKFWEVLTGPM